MNARSIRIGAVLASVLFAGGAAQAALIKFAIDPVNSFVHFKIKNRDISYVYGRFNKISGSIGVNELDHPTRIGVDAEVEARSVDTNDKKRDKHLEASDFLNASKFKTISFKTIGDSKELGDDKFEITGELTLLGVTKEITVTFEITGAKAMEKGARRVGGQTTFTIKRSEFGMGAMIPDIADEVTIMVNLEAERAQTAAG